MRVDADGQVLAPWEGEECDWSQHVHEQRESELCVAYERAAEVEKEPANGRNKRPNLDPGAFLMPFGRYKGARVFDIARDDDGLCYLLWVWAEVGMGPQLRQAVETVLTGKARLKRIRAIARNGWGNAKDQAVAFLSRRPASDAPRRDLIRAGAAEA
jgi:hypothetical protein